MDLKCVILFSVSLFILCSTTAKVLQFFNKPFTKYHSFLEILTSKFYQLYIYIIPKQYLFRKGWVFFNTRTAITL